MEFIKRIKEQLLMGEVLNLNYGSRVVDADPEKGSITITDSLGSKYLIFPEEPKDLGEVPWLDLILLQITRGDDSVRDPIRVYFQDEMKEFLDLDRDLEREEILVDFESLYY